MAVAPRGMSVQEAYREFRDGNFRVNRKYQRKLVWTVDEKKKLIDSLLASYPIPLLLLGFKIREDGSKSFEILDGMQRLNAIFSFIECSFDIDGKFFDLEQLTRAKALAAEGKIARPPVDAQLLSADECARLLEYTLAVTEFPATDEQAVTDIFGRINSSGRQLSDQERRQAGVLSPFANLVREVASELRGDVSSDSLDLAQMPAISIDVGENVSPHAIKADETFWCRQGVLRKSQLRESEDEQMVADLAVSVLLNTPFGFSGGALDEVYDTSSDEGRDIGSRLAVYGATRLKHELVSSIAVMRGIIEDVDPLPNAFRKRVHPTHGGNPAKTAFYAVFMAIFDLCVRQKKSPKHGAHPRIMAAIANLQGSLEVAAGAIRSEPRQKNINIVKGLIQDEFEDKEPSILLHGEGETIRFENALRRSRIETAAYECKQGVLRLDANRGKDPGILDKLVETICAIANIGPTSSGAIFIGVADNAAAQKRIIELDSILPAAVGERWCVGIDREAKLLGQAVEQYARAIASHIQKSNLSEPLRTAVCASIDTVVYRGHSVVCIWVPTQKAASDVGDVLYVRSGSETLKVEGLKRTRALMALFE